MRRGSALKSTKQGAGKIKERQRLYLVIVGVITGVLSNF